MIKNINPSEINNARYEELYEKSISDNENFWAEQAEEFLSFEEKWTRVRDFKFSKEEVHIKWFEGAKLNACYNCVDRHVENGKGENIALIWEGDNPEDSEKISYGKLQKEVSKFANILKNLGVKRGEVVTIYMPMILEAVYAMLACARIGAIHSVVFGGFSPEALKGRIEDGRSKIVITADEGVRGGKHIPLKDNVDEAIKDLDNIRSLVIKRTGADINWRENLDFWYHKQYQEASDICECEIMDAEDPLFILYTSGSTGKPKGLMHSIAGYLLYTAITHKYVFDYQDNDIYWCTADVGWITGHSYIVYGPLANGATSLVFEGVPTYPSADRFFQIVDKHKVNQFYTAPTAIRMLMGKGDESYKNTDRSSLRILGTVGEPINPEAWRWYNEKIGHGKCPIVDTWWQTETGGFLITPLPYATKLKAGSATKPFFGIKPAIVDKDNNEIKGEGHGSLCILESWPGQARTIWGDHKRFIETYFKQYDGRYFSGDGAKRDKDEYYWITGRMDDVINVSGHRLGTAEIESALVLHKYVAEAAVVAYKHEIKGQGIYAFIDLNQDAKDSASKNLEKELQELVKKEIGSIAKPQKIQFVSSLPKTRSGKIMRRILRKIANDDFHDLGDTRTLVNPEIIDELIDNRL
jgi:acetyl-CoA synthetase